LLTISDDVDPLPHDELPLVPAWEERKNSSAWKKPNKTSWQGAPYFATTTTTVAGVHEEDAMGATIARNEALGGGRCKVVAVQQQLRRPGLSRARS
jgi:hypothetical protein